MDRVQQLCGCLLTLQSLTTDLQGSTIKRVHTVSPSADVFRPNPCHVDGGKPVLAGARASSELDEDNASQSLGLARNIDKQTRSESVEAPPESPLPVVSLQK